MASVSQVRLALLANTDRQPESPIRKPANVCRRNTRTRIAAAATDLDTVTEQDMATAILAMDTVTAIHITTVATDTAAILTTTAIANPKIV